MNKCTRDQMILPRVTRLMATEDVHVLIPEPVTVTSHGRGDFAEVIKAPEMHRSSWTIHWARCNHKDVYKSKREEEESVRERGRCCETRNAGASRSWKKPENRLSPEPLEEPALSTPDLSPWGPFWTPALQSRKILNLFCFKPWIPQRVFTAATGSCALGSSAPTPVHPPGPSHDTQPTTRLWEPSHCSGLTTPPSPLLCTLSSHLHRCASSSSSACSRNEGSRSRAAATCEAHGHEPSLETSKTLRPLVLEQNVLRLTDTHAVAILAGGTVVGWASQSESLSCEADPQLWVGPKSGELAQATAQERSGLRHHNNNNLLRTWSIKSYSYT